MKIFDSHIHTQFDKASFQEVARQTGINFSMNGLANEMQSNAVEYAITISNIFEDATPIGLAEMIEQQQTNSQLRAICAINPNRTGKNELVTTEQALANQSIIGLKIFLGYYPFAAIDPIYQAYYQLAQKYSSVVFFHTGDVYSPEGGYLKYSQPLAIDELAVNYPQVTFILAHAGNPWFIDAGAIAYKNKNVWLDISGLDLGVEFKNTANIESGIKFLLDYAGPDKIIYGSDWPLVGMAPYLNMLKDIVPVQHHDKIFFQNAWQIFGKYFQQK